MSEPQGERTDTYGAMTPRPEVCVGAVGVVGERLLLVRRANEPGRGLWSVPGGRVEPGEGRDEAGVRGRAAETGVLAAYMVVASKTAVFGIPEVKRNLVAAAGGLFRLPRKIPRNIAMELALTGRLDFPAEQAHHFGLVNHLAEEGGALERAKELAAQICQAAPLAVAESRKIVIEATDQPDDVGWKMSGEGIMKMFGTEDFSEGLTAFAEKRDPVWKGR